MSNLFMVYINCCILFDAHHGYSVPLFALCVHVPFMSTDCHLSVIKEVFNRSCCCTSLVFKIGVLYSVHPRRTHF